MAKQSECLILATPTEMRPIGREATEVISDKAVERPTKSPVPLDKLHVIEDDVRIWHCGLCGWASMAHQWRLEMKKIICLALCLVFLGGSTVSSYAQQREEAFRKL